MFVGILWIKEKYLANKIWLWRSYGKSKNAQQAIDGYGRPVGKGKTPKKICL
jgi:hypothetical protein